jgi:hypothetical protein
MLYYWYKQYRILCNIDIVMICTTNSIYFHVHTNRLAFVKETRCVLCGVGTELLYFIRR